MNRSGIRVPSALLVTLVTCGLAAGADWHHPFHLDGGGYWSGRIRLVITNEQDSAAEGRPVVVTVGDKPGQANLAGKKARALRVCSAQGTEMLFAVHAADGGRITSRPIPTGSQLVIPAECPAGEKAQYYVYFDNPAAGEVPDHLSVRTGLVNGDVESGQGDTPSAWTHDAPDDTHRAAWTNEQAQSGKRCLKTVVAPGAEPTWIATRQHGIQIDGGAKYRMTAWVKADNVKGSSGWYIHLGNGQNAMLTSPMLTAGEGSFDWKQVSAEFTAPEDADRADLGTVLRGTGTAWFDNVRLECLTPGRLSVTADPPEILILNQIGADQAWDPPASSSAVGWDHRAVVKVFNFSDRPIVDSLVSLDQAVFEGRMRGRLNPDSIKVTLAGRQIPFFRHGNSLLVEGDVPAKSVAIYYIGFSDDPRIKRTATPSRHAGEEEDRETPAIDVPRLRFGLVSAANADRASATATMHNLVKNPGFESGEQLPNDWTASGPAKSPQGVTYGFDEPGREDLGKRCAKMHVPADLPEGWRGWQQSVPVEPGRTYLVATWVKCQGIRSGNVTLHAHRHTAAGRLSAHQPMISVGTSITGDTDWTLLSGLTTMPEDTVSLRLHLTMNLSGTLWHDGVLVAEVTPGEIVRFEGRPVAPSDGLKVWPVRSVVKVFPDDPVPRRAVPAEISSARNERETLQLAVRGPRAIENVRVEVERPVGPNGKHLDDVQINVVGYVPIDHATSYYRSEAPAWHRLYPGRSAGCDGWPGLWPDPLLPRDTFDLAANATQPVWITVAVAKDAPAGDYQGAVQFVADGRQLAEVPFELHVWDFSLPDENHLAAIYDVRFGPGSRWWGKPLDDQYPEIVRFMAERRLCPDAIRPSPTFEIKDGRVVADFGRFDKAAEFYFDELGLPFSYTPWSFYLFGWGHPPKTFMGQRPYRGDPPYEDADRSQLRPEYKAAYQACLKTFWDHVKQKGWADKFILYISDEPFDRHEHIRTQMRALCDMIHEVDPQIPIYCSTWKHVPEWDGYLDVWGIGHYGRVAVDKMAELRTAGDRLWFTTDGQMCTDTPYCAVERLLPHYCFKYGVQAYEFWGVGWLTYDPYRYGWHSYIRQSGEPGEHYWVRYPNGDGFLLYPGDPIGHPGPVSSIRLEQAREGVEDYEYLYLLKRLVSEGKSSGKDTTQADAALQSAAELVTIPNAGGRYSSKILPEPERLYETRKALAEAIERCR